MGMNDIKQFTKSEKELEILIKTENIVKILIWFGLVWFDGISTFVGYLRPTLFLYK